MTDTATKSQFAKIFGRKDVISIASRLTETWPDFPYEEFVNKVMRDFDELGFPEAFRRIRDCLRLFLPQDPSVAARLLADSLEPEPNNRGRRTGTRL